MLDAFGYLSIIYVGIISLSLITNQHILETILRGAVVMISTCVHSVKIDFHYHFLIRFFILTHIPFGIIVLCLNQPPSKLG